jgi:hypothetical protein
MKTLFAIVILGLAFSSCFKSNDNAQFNQTCSGDSCTTISGVFTTGNNTPIANIPVEIASETSGLLGTKTREIASGKTDKNGYYSFTFNLKSDEYGYGAAPLARLYMRYTYDPSKFLAMPFYTDNGVKEYFGRFSRKDTAVTANVFVTSKSEIKVRLENFSPVQAGDYFTVSGVCSAGINKQDNYSYSTVRATGTLTEQELDVCGDEQTRLVIVRMKNGVITSTDTTVNTPVNVPLTVSFTY